ncbi:hypothetical protein FXO38_03002 [Capsicum annuum]|nr:hypothetical protein FXO38_03002 [Capsicum annuum]
MRHYRGGSPEIDEWDSWGDYDADPSHCPTGGPPYNSTTPRAIWIPSLTRRPSLQPKFPARVGVFDSDTPQGTRPAYNPSWGHNNPILEKHDFRQRVFLDYFLLWSESFKTYPGRTLDTPDHESTYKLTFREVKIVGSIHHVNLVKLIGFCAKKSERLLIYDYMVNGSLNRWISAKIKRIGFTWNTRQRIISDIAKGLTCLHDLVITEKVDVYAFGIVLLKILCGRKNLDWYQADEEDVHLLSIFRRKAEQEQLMNMVDRNKGMQLHRKVVTKMMSCCIVSTGRFLQETFHVIGD